MNLGTATVIRGDARHLPLADNTVDLVVTSPPYFALRSYQDGCKTCADSSKSHMRGYMERYCPGCGKVGTVQKCPKCDLTTLRTEATKEAIRKRPADPDCPECQGTGTGHYAGQIGDEPTPTEFVDSLIEVTAECMRVLKPSGSIFVNLGDSYAGAPKAEPIIGRGQRERRTRVEQFTREDAAWLAGVIDSDGSIGIHINKQADGRSPSFVPWVRIGQMRPEVVEHAADVCGTGKVMQDGRGVWNWSASAQQARWVLERIHPWLLIKKRQAWAAIEIARHVEERNAKGSWRQLTVDDVAYRQRLREAVMAWNRGEPDDCPVPDPGRVSLPIYPYAPRAKSLHDIPHAYALACVGELGLIKRAEICWSKPNGLPESCTDRVRRSHEFFFHFTLGPRYFSAVDEIREQHAGEFLGSGVRNPRFGRPGGLMPKELRGELIGDGNPHRKDQGTLNEFNPLGKLPGSVWTVPTEPLTVPAHLGVDHFACVDAETEVMTRRGWLHHDALRDDDEVAGYDLDTGLTRWTRVHGIHRYNYDGELVAADARGLSMRLTPNHRTLAHRHAGRHQFRQPVEVIRADEVTKNHAIPRAVEWAEDGREKAIGSDFAALLGWVAAEGWYSEGNAVYLSQSLSANPSKVAEIDTLIDRLGGAYRTVRERQWRGRPAVDAQWRLHMELGSEVRGAMPTKLLPMVDLPLDEARTMLDAFIDGDGHRRPDGRIAIFQKERHNLDVLQSHAVRLGYNTTLTQQPERWILYLNPPRPARLRRSDGASLVSREQYRGVVWCVTTGTGTFVARRRGTVFVTGNSFPSEWPRRIIMGWSPSGVCTGCGQGRRPVSVREEIPDHVLARYNERQNKGHLDVRGVSRSSILRTGIQTGQSPATTITGYACDCAEPTAPTTPSVILDPFGGTGTTALVAKALGRHGISVDMSLDYGRLARWRTNDLDQLAKVQGIKRSDQARAADGLDMDTLFDMETQPPAPTPLSRTCPECGFRNNLSNRRNCEKCGAEKERTA